MLMRPFLVVPTHTHPPLLDVIVERADMPAIAVLTRPGVAPVDGAVNVEDHGPVNIHRWWNVGIEQAASRGADVAVVVNHDAEPAPGALRALVDGLARTGATIAYPAAQDGPADTFPGGRRRITGWCFALNLTHGLRAPELLRWWYGDDWLCWQARAQHRGVASVAADVRHRNPDPNRLVEPFASIVRVDQVVWWRLRGLA